ncbi:ADP-ribosyl-[dinitrogen reductase] hydrolase [Trichlorobacter ammonificans]|uniref:ADP-ribosyl-[dinitrogen reductase] glycohydrolase n=1 Tax=Trichlorobacter ammonificans TaxID=2916410 RepID=A0ABM9D583_9BACT|nr:ADP-ribosyl-[dinitrogen reductase] glycohydrolase [Trichlorobacter ammonificans]
MILQLDMRELTDRARAAFVGMAIGDALGATVEFMTAAEIAAQHGVFKEISGGGWLRLQPGQVTDDTEMALCIARAVNKAQGWSREAIAQEFAVWLKSRPVDCGDTCRKGIRSFMLHGTLEVPYNTWDGGNGAVMRMLPAALLSLPDTELMKKYALEQARITHHQHLSDAACICLGSLLHLILRGFSKARLRREVDGLVARFPSFAFEPYRGLAGAYVADTMQTVFHHFFRGRSFEECLVGTVNQGGDADTTGAITGMLAGAYYGMEAIPRRWLKKMDKKLLTELEQHAERLVLASPAGRAGAGNVQV